MAFACFLFSPCSHVQNERIDAKWDLLKNMVFHKWCPHNIFISCHNPATRPRNSSPPVRSSLLSLCCPPSNSRCYILVSRWLMLVDRSMFYVPRRLLLPDSCPLLVSRFWFLASCSFLLATRCSLHFQLLACRCPLVALSCHGCQVFCSASGSPSHYRYTQALKWEIWDFKKYKLLFVDNLDLTYFFQLWGFVKPQGHS